MNITLVVEYDPAWPELFQRHASEIKRALGATAVRVEHVGSTAVPHLMAKPIVDILLTVPDSGDESLYVPQLEPVGYTVHIREPEFHEHRLLKVAGGAVHLHVFSNAAPEVGRMLKFRDRLRSNPDDRREYEQTKRRLAQQPWKTMDEYAAAKTDVVERLLSRG